MSFINKMCPVLKHKASKLKLNSKPRPAAPSVGAPCMLDAMDHQYMDEGVFLCREYRPLKFKQGLIFRI